MNLNKMPKSLDQISNDLGMIPAFVETPTHANGEQLDWCLTNFKENEMSFEIKVYESFFSEHSPIWLYLSIN